MNAFVLISGLLSLAEQIIAMAEGLKQDEILPDQQQLLNEKINNTTARLLALAAKPESETDTNV